MRFTLRTLVGGELLFPRAGHNLEGRRGCRHPQTSWRYAMTVSLRTLAPLLAASFCLPALADSCYVRVNEQTGIQLAGSSEYCFEHQGMPADSFDWVCDDEERSKDLLGTRKRERDKNCPTGYFGKCTATLTQESLATEQATGQYGEGVFTAPQIPDDAKLVTYHYQASGRAQAKVDCESAGGRWTQVGGL